MRRRLFLACLLFWSPWIGANPGKSHFFKSSDGVAIHYIEAGSGEMTLVFIPGWLMPARIFDKQLADLSRDYRVIMLAPRGQVFSKTSPQKLDAIARARDIDELLRHARVRDHVLVGWSLGVMEVLDYSTRYVHQDLRGLVLIPALVINGANVMPFILWSSLFVLVYGIAYAVGTWKAWPHLRRAR